MLQLVLKDFIDNVASMPPSLINPAWMEKPQTFDDRILLVFDIENAYTLGHVLNILEDDVELVTLYHHIASDHTAYGQSLCVFSNPNLGRLFKITAQTEEDGRVPYIYVTLYKSSEQMLADLQMELSEHALVGMFKKHLTEEELLLNFMRNGINDNIYKRVVSLINKNHTNIIIADSKLYMEHTIAINGRQVTCLCRTLVLQACKEGKSYRNGQIWNIPDIELKRALIEYSRGKYGFKDKIAKDTLALTANDVQKIVCIATGGEVNLNLKTACIRENEVSTTYQI